MNFLKNLESGQSFRLSGEHTFYIAESVYVEGPFTTVVYRLASDDSVHYMFTKSALTSVVFGA